MVNGEITMGSSKTPDLPIKLVNDSTSHEDLPLFEKQISARPSSKHKDLLANPGFSPPDYGKYVVYVDESGDYAMKTIDEQYPVFVLAFCVFHKEHYSEKVVPALERFKFKHFGHDQVVLHEHEIRKEKGAFRIFPTKDHKLNFLRDLSVIVEDHNFILISCVIDKKGLRDQQEAAKNPYHIALRFCLETLFEFLKEKGKTEKLTHIIVEQRGKKEDNDLELDQACSWLTSSPVLSA